MQDYCQETVLLIVAAALGYVFIIILAAFIAKVTRWNSTFEYLAPVLTVVFILGVPQLTRFLVTKAFLPQKIFGHNTTVVLWLALTAGMILKMRYYTKVMRSRTGRE